MTFWATLKNIPFQLKLLWLLVRQLMAFGLLFISTSGRTSRQVHEQQPTLEKVKEGIFISPPFWKQLILHFSLGWPFGAKNLVDFFTNKNYAGREPWSSGYGRRLMLQRSWLRIPAPNTGRTFFTFIFCKNCNVCLKKTKINEKVAGEGHFYKKKK